MGIREWKTRFKAWAISTTPETKTDGSEDGRRIISNDLWSFGIGAAVFGYFAADYLLFFPQTHRVVFGLVALLGIVMLHRGLSTRVRWKQAAWLAPILIALFFILFASGDYISSASMASEAADVRCSHIQREMLSAHPRRNDLPDIFGALGCHASGTEDVSLPEPVAS